MLQILDPRPLLDDAAAINARYNSGGWLISETLAAAVVHGRQLWFGRQGNVGERLEVTADQLGIDVHLIER